MFILFNDPDVPGADSNELKKIVGGTGEFPFFLSVQKKGNDHTQCGVRSSSIRPERIRKNLSGQCIVTVVDEATNGAN